MSRDGDPKDRALGEEWKRDSPNDEDERAFLRRDGIVISIAKRTCVVASGDDLVECTLPANIAAEQQSRIAIGDEVTFEPKADRHVVVDIAPRRTVLSRPDPHSRSERVVAANIDVVVHVASAKNPPLKPGLIDRYLIAIGRGGADAAIVVNKADLLDHAERRATEEQLAIYGSLGVPVVYASAKSGEGIAELHELFRGKMCVFVGHSGVGKSSLLNALDPSLRLATNTLHRAGTAGRHTTTQSTLYRFSDGTKLIDTPGVREFGLWEIDRKSLSSFFPEFDDYAQACRFNDCTHLHEPDCAVKDAVESGEIQRQRYEHYQRLSAEVG